MLTDGLEAFILYWGFWTCTSIVKPVGHIPQTEATALHLSTSSASHQFLRMCACLCVHTYLLAFLHVHVCLGRLRSLRGSVLLGDHAAILVRSDHSPCSTLTYAVLDLGLLPTHPPMAGMRQAGLEGVDFKNPHPLAT